jgi:hypothetical protein
MQHSKNTSSASKLNSLPPIQLSCCLTLHSNFPLSYAYAPAQPFNFPLPAWWTQTSLDGGSGQNGQELVPIQAGSNALQ